MPFVFITENSLIIVIKASLVAQSVKNLPAMLETRVWSLGQEDFLRKQQHTPVLLPGKSHEQRSLGARVHGVVKS